MELVGRQIVFLNKRSNYLIDIQEVEILWRDVDRQAEFFKTVSPLRPGGEDLAGFFPNVVVQNCDQSFFLKNRNEIDRDLGIRTEEIRNEQN